MYKMQTYRVDIIDIQKIEEYNIFVDLVESIGLTG